MWPFPKRVEKREAAPFSDAVVGTLVAQAGGAAEGDPGAIAALKAAAGLYARAFSIADVAPANAVTRSITPQVLGLIARNLIRRGEDVHLCELRGDAPRLVPVGSWDVRGGSDEEEWWYRADRFGPSGNFRELYPRVTKSLDPGHRVRYLTVTT